MRDTGDGRSCCLLHTGIEGLYWQNKYIIWGIVFFIFILTMDGAMSTQDEQTQKQQHTHLTALPAVGAVADGLAGCRKQGAGKLTLTRTW